MADPEYPGNEKKKPKRKDGKDLTKAWLDRYGDKGAYVWNKEQFAAIDPAKTDHLLGLFEPSHMQYEHDRAGDEAGEPSLAEMAEKAIDILSRNPEGFVLLVEGGRIDHGSHESNAYRTLSDGVAMNEAVKAVLRKVNLDETLIVVTGDHSHTLTISGYAKRGNPILGISIGVDDEPIYGTRRQNLHHDRLRQWSRWLRQAPRTANVDIGGNHQTRLRAALARASRKRDAWR